MVTIFEFIMQFLAKLVSWEGTCHLNAWDHGDGLDNDEEFLNSSCNSWPN